MNSTTATFLQQKNGDSSTINTLSSPQGGENGAMKGPKPVKMISRAFLFADDPNCIEVLASEGDQALTTYVLDFDVMWATFLSMYCHTKLLELWVRVRCHIMQFNIT